MVSGLTLQKHWWEQGKPEAPQSPRARLDLGESCGSAGAAGTDGPVCSHTCERFLLEVLQGLSPWDSGAGGR